MEKCYWQLKIILIIFLSLVIFNSGNICSAADNLKNAFGTPLNNAAGTNGAGYNTGTTVSLDNMISSIITTALGFLGIIFLVLAIYGGYTWMMARGNDEMVDKAKKTITNAIIGLIVVLGAYAISWFIVNVIGGKVFK